MNTEKGNWKITLELTAIGGIVFWLANFAISRTPIAAEYRNAMSISYYPMLLQSLIGGLVIGLCVSFFLTRFFEKVPGETAMIKSILLSLILLILVTVIIGGPSSFLATGNIIRYFLIGTAFNVIRILALGMGIGYFYERSIRSVYR